MDYYIRMVKTLHAPEYRYLISLLVEARKKSGLTQVEVSLKLDRPQSFVSKYEAGERRLDVIEFIQVCKVLGVDPHSLIADIETGGTNGHQ